MLHVYTTTNPNKYSDDFAGMSYIGMKETSDAGYTKEFALGEAAHIIPESVGGSTTSCKCDFHKADRSNSRNTLVVGGSASDDSKAGLGYFEASRSVTNYS